MGRWLLNQARGPVVKGLMLATLLGSVLVGRALPQELVGADLAGTEQLLQRLDAAEAEIRYLRQRDEERAQLEDQVLRRLPAIPAAVSADVSSNYLLNDAGADGCGCEPVPVCQGVGTLCQNCKESLSWNKGPWRIVPFGSLTGELIYAQAQTVSRPMILYLLDGSPPDNKQITIHGQTSSLGFNFSGPSVGNFEMGGMILFNFLGDRPALNQATPFFVRGYGELKNEDWRFTFGQQGDLFNPLDPVTVNFGSNKQAGNGGSFRGSLRAERYLRPNENVQWTIQTAISQQVVTDFVVNPFILGTDNGWPNIEGRIGLGLGMTESGARPLEVGLSGVVGQTRAFGPLGQGLFPTWGITVDSQINAGRWGVRGEFFMGQAVGTYNLGIGQSLDPTGDHAIRTIGGWGDVWYKLTPYLIAHVGYGIDDPFNQDLGQFFDENLMPIAGQRSRNSVLWANVIWNVTEIFDLAFEVSHRETGYIAPSISNDAMIFHFRARFNF